MVLWSHQPIHRYPVKHGPSFRLFPRYRGVAVNVEDRDQTYSSVDVRDVVVLDPDVGCHPGCLLRSAVDAFQQPGWEFSVQVKPPRLWNLT